MLKKPKLAENYQMVFHIKEAQGDESVKWKKNNSALGKSPKVRRVAQKELNTS